MRRFIVKESSDSKGHFMFVGRVIEGKNIDEINKKMDDVLFNGGGSYTYVDLKDYHQSNEKHFIKAKLSKDFKFTVECIINMLQEESADLAHRAPAASLKSMQLAFKLRDAI